VFYGTSSTNRLYHAIEVGNVSHRAGGEHKYHAVKQQKEYNKPTQSQALFGLGFMEMITSPWLGFLRWSF